MGLGIVSPWMRLQGRKRGWATTSPTLRDGTGVNRTSEAARSSCPTSGRQGLLGVPAPTLLVARLRAEAQIDVAVLSWTGGRLLMETVPGSVPVAGAGKTLTGFSVGRLPRVAEGSSAAPDTAHQLLLTLAPASNFGTELCADFILLDEASSRPPSRGSLQVSSFTIAGRTRECREAGAAGLAGPPARLTGLVGDFYGDGRNAIAALSSSSAGAYVKLLDLVAGDLVGSDWKLLDPEPWSVATRGRWLPNPSGEPWHQVLAVREPPPQAGDWDIDVVVFGGPKYLLGRKRALAGTRSQYIYKSAKPEPQDILAAMNSTYTNTHSLLICGPHTYSSYPFFLEFLEASKDFAVAGEQVRVWATLLPPSEAPRDNCVPPPESEITPFNDTAVFDGDPELGYQDYEAWTRLLAAVAVLYPHFVVLNIDDFSHNLSGVKGGVRFSPGLVARMTSTLRAHNPDFAFVPTLYYSQSGRFVFAAHPGVGYALDQPLFYFRNDKQGPGPCAATECPWGPAFPAGEPRAGGCLAGACCISTAENFASEVGDVLMYLPPGRRVHVGFYATGHSRLGNPDPLYVLRLMPNIMSHAAVAGITVYVFQNPALEDCFQGPAASKWRSDKGCIVARLFREASLARLDAR